MVTATVLLHMTVGIALFQPNSDHVEFNGVGLSKGFAVTIVPPQKVSPQDL